MQQHQQYLDIRVITLFAFFFFFFLHKGYSQEKKCGCGVARTGQGVNPCDSALSVIENKDGSRDIFIPVERTTTIYRNGTTTVSKLRGLARYHFQANNKAFDTVKSDTEVKKIINRQEVKAADTIFCNRQPDCYDCDTSGYIVYDPGCKTFKWCGVEISRLSRSQKRELAKLKEYHVYIPRFNRYLYSAELRTTELFDTSIPPPVLGNIFLGTGTIMDNLITTLQKNITDKLGGNSRGALQDLLDALTALRHKYNLLRDNQAKAYMECADFPCCNPDSIVTFTEIDRLFDEVRDVARALKMQQAEDTARMVDIIADPPNEQTKNLTLRQLENARILLHSIDSLINEMKPSDTDMAKLIYFNNQLHHDKFYFLSPPIYPQSGSLTVSLKIKNATPLISAAQNIAPVVNDSAWVEIPVAFKPYISFSTGIFVGIEQRLHGLNYAWRAVPDVGTGMVSDTTRYRLVRDGYTETPLGFSALVNFNFARLSPQFLLGFSIGAGVTLKRDPDIAYLSGISLVAGREKQLAFTFGVAMMSINSSLSAGLSESAYYTKDHPDISYNKQLAIGWMAGISYTVFNPERRQQLRSGAN